MVVKGYCDFMKHFKMYEIIKFLMDIDGICDCCNGRFYLNLFRIGVAVQLFL